MSGITREAETELSSHPQASARGLLGRWLFQEGVEFGDG